MSKQRVVAYGADKIDSLRTLEDTCERDESRLTSKLVQLNLSIIDEPEEKEATAATYEETEEDGLGHLIFEVFTNENDALSRIAIHKAKQEPHVCSGKAFINNTKTNVIVFREKQ